MLESLFSCLFTVSFRENKMLSLACVPAVWNRLFRMLDSYSKPKNTERESKCLSNVHLGKIT